MTAMDAQNSGKSVVKTTIGYNDPSSTTATGQVRTWKSGATTYTYAYDARGNITSVSDGQSTTTYAYDSFDQLVRENNQAAGKTWTYVYDDGGNIQSKTEYAYTTGSLGAAVRTIPYGYGDASWSDLLTSIGGQSLTADEIGNLLSDGTWTYTWQHGRQLAGMSKTGQTIAYGYDSDGKRITKTVNGTEYFYAKNAQGDVTGLVNASGTRVVTYTYDAWGNLLSTSGSMASTLGEQNPLRYRGYVYDTETGLYYLQSRYYNPGWGRFINADDMSVLRVSPSKANWDKNLFAYCDNNPVNRVDSVGDLWTELFLGAGISAAFNLAGQLKSNGGDWTSVDWCSVGHSELGGAASALCGIGFAKIAGNVAANIASKCLGNVVELAVNSVGGALGGILESAISGEISNSEDIKRSGEIGGGQQLLTDTTNNAIRYKREKNLTAPTRVETRKNIQTIVFRKGNSYFNWNWKTYKKTPQYKRYINRFTNFVSSAISAAFKWLF